MATLIFVHGAFQGAWVWSKVADFFVQAGHTVFCPTLAGLADRAHELNAHIGLNDHIQDICALIDKHNLRDVILIGHSYGGMVISGVIKEKADKLSHVVYLDAIVPDDNQSLLDALGSHNAQVFINSAQQEGNGWKVPALPPEAFGLIEQSDITWGAALLTAQSLKTFTDKVSMLENCLLPKTYIHCTQSNQFIATQAAKAKARGWQCIEIETPHAPMISHPKIFLETMLKYITHN